MSISLLIVIKKGIAYRGMPSGIQTDSFCKLHDIYLKLKDDFVTDRSSDLWPQFSNRTVHLIMRGKRQECKAKFLVSGMTKKDHLS